MHVNKIAYLLILLVTYIHVGSAAASPSPPIWPETFHALAVQNRNGSLALVDLYYEWKKGRNANLIHRQLGTMLYDIEYNNKTSYYFDKELGTCKKMAFPVGILMPDWLANATYLGTDSVDTYDTHVWTKSEGFIKYWADIKTGLPHSSAEHNHVKNVKVGLEYKPQDIICSTGQAFDMFRIPWQVRWRFFDGAQFEIMTFTEGKTLRDEEWQAPEYCFTQKGEAAADVS